MSRRCEICGKTSTVGNSITRSGSPKYKGGIGLNTGGVAKRRFYPNVQRIKALVDGTVKRIRVCARCVKAGKVARPAARPSQIEASARQRARRVAEEAAKAAAIAAAAAAAQAELEEVEEPEEPEGETARPRTEEKPGAEEKQPRPAPEEPSPPQSE